MNETKPHFTKLSPKDLEDLLEMIVKQKSSIRIWSREEDLQEEGKPEDFSISPPSLKVYSPLKPGMNNKEVLLNFSLTNRMYFTTAKVTETDEDNRFNLALSAKVFKCEQRRSFRLISTPAQRLEIVLDGIRYEATDVSVSGIAILIEKGDSPNFKEENGYDNVLLKINNKEFIIPFCKIIHKRPFQNDPSQVLLGIEFIEVGRPLEIELYRTINDLLFTQLKG